MNTAMYVTFISDWYKNLGFRVKEINIITILLVWGNL
jgi:hypothetical protein